MPQGAPNDPGAPSAARIYLTSDPPTLDIPVEIVLQLVVSDDPAPAYPFEADEPILVIADSMPGTYRVSVDGMWCGGSFPLTSTLETDVRLELRSDDCTVAFGEPHPIGDGHTLE